MNTTIDVLQDDYPIECFEDRNTIAFREAIEYWKTISEDQYQKDDEEMMLSLAEEEKRMQLLKV